MIRTAPTWIAAAVLALATGAGAQPTTTTPSTTAPAKAATSALSRGDHKFMEHAAQGGMAEVALGRLAGEKATNPQVKAFGERMVQDHGKANDELRQLATTKGVQLPQDHDRKHRREADRLGKKTGADFDHEYMEHMVDDHKKDVKDFQDAAKDAKDPDLKAWAAKTLPVLQEHLSLAQATYDAVKGGKRSAAAAPAMPASR